MHELRKHLQMLTAAMESTYPPPEVIFAGFPDNCLCHKLRTPTNDGESSAECIAPDQEQERDHVPLREFQTRSGYAFMVTVCYRFAACI